MEPTYCDYHLKVSTKFMCAKVKTLPKASVRLMSEKSEFDDLKQTLMRGMVDLKQKQKTTCEFVS